MTAPMQMATKYTANRRASWPYGATSLTILPAAMDASCDLSMAVPRAKESAIERRTGPLIAAHASRTLRQPVRSSTQRQPSAASSSAFGFCAASAIVAASSPSASHSRPSPLGARAGAAPPAGGGLASTGPPAPGRRRGAKRSMYAVPAAALISPTAVMSKTPIAKEGSCASAAVRATRLVDEPISVIVPPSIVANESGMSIPLAGRPSDAVHCARIGIIIAQTGVLFMKAEIPIVASSIRSSATPYDEGLPSSTRAMSSSPPVVCTPFATAHITPTETTPSEEKPASASFIEITPAPTSATAASRSTCSGRPSSAI
mmetsp:Transcript_44450/g.110622  ORF Transcript_44450/g.110622 Transcript_44450/m.110622 type:complete len:317 (-) Transcript_44450:140-1090(-)